MGNSFAPPPEGVVDVAAWERFCGLIALGSGVCNQPDRPERQVRASDLFFREEVNRVEHHQRNSIPFLAGHCGLAGRSVLEFGAGTGGLSVALARAGVHSVDAVEPTGLNVQAGRWRVRAYGLEKAIRFHHLPDTTHLPWAGESFDAVVCSSVLQYIPEPRRRRTFLKEMARVVRPGGLLVVCATGNGLYPGGPHSSRWWSNLLPTLAARCGHERGVTYWEIRRVLAPVGFRALPEGNVSLERWRRRVAARVQAGRRRFVLSAFWVIAGALSLLTRAPAEAFLPYPELAFQKRENCPASIA